MVTVPRSPLTLILSPENGGEEIPLSPLAGSRVRETPLSCAAKGQGEGLPAVA
jgi:hypothetical protein